MLLKLTQRGRVGSMRFEYIHLVHARLAESTVAEVIRWGSTDSRTPTSWGIISQALGHIWKKSKIQQPAASNRHGRVQIEAAALVSYKRSVSIRQASKAFPERATQTCKNVDAEQNEPGHL